jgi:hypothetical protein
LLCAWHGRIGDRAALTGIVDQLHTGIPTHLLPASILSCVCPILRSAPPTVIACRQTAESS